MNKKTLLNLIRVLISVGLIAFLFWLMRGSLGDVAATIKKVNKPLLFLSFIIYAGSISLLGVRLKFIMTAQRLHITLRRAAYLTFIGFFFNNFLPTSAGGDVVKAYYAVKWTHKKMPTIACIILDRIIGTFTFFVMAFMAYLFIKVAFADKLIKTFIAVTAIASLVIIAMLFNKRIAGSIPFIGAIFRMFNLEEKMKGIYEVLHNYKAHPRLLLNAVFISVALQIATFSAVYVIARGLNVLLPFKYVLLLMPIICTASMAPSINGLGVREGSFVFFFGPIIGKEEAFALSILWLGVSFGVSLIGGALYLIGSKEKIPAIIKMKEEV